MLRNECKILRRIIQRCQSMDFRYWHEADIKPRPLFDRFGVESGQQMLDTSLSAFDPKRTSRFPRDFFLDCAESVTCPMQAAW